MLSFVYDIADLYKTDLSVPVAFRVAARRPAELERAVRMECRSEFRQFKLMDRLLPDIAEVLGAGDDLGEGPDELEGRIVTLAVRAEDRGFPWQPERQGA